MKESNHQLLIGGLFGAILLGCVAVLFIVFRPAEPSPVYWFNLVYSLLMAGAVASLFCFSNLRTRRVSSAFMWVLYLYIGLYILSALTLMAAYFVMVEPGVARWVGLIPSVPRWIVPVLEQASAVFATDSSLARAIYFVAMMMLTAAAALALLIIYRHDTAYTAETEAAVALHRTAKSYADRVGIVALQAESLHSAVLHDIIMQLRQLERKVRTITPSMMQQGDTEMQLQSVVDDVCSLVEPLQDPSTPPSADTVNSITTRLKAHLITIELIKKQTL